MTEHDRGKEKLKLGGRIISFIGPEGSGKTIQALRLATESGLPYVTTSGILHELKMMDNALGEEIRQMFASHTYLDGLRLLEILCEYIKSNERLRSGFILDGGFRTPEETAGFRKMLERAELRTPVLAVYLQISEEESYRRLLERGREDDTPEGITSRLEKFKDRLAERIAIIRSEPDWDITEIDAMRGIDEVYQNILEAVNGE